MAAQLTDAQVFGSSSSPELSDEQVFGSGAYSPKAIQGAPIVTQQDFSTVPTAAAEGWRNAPKIIPQEEIDKANQYPLGYWLTSPVMQTINAPLQAANALFRGGQQTVQEALTPLIGETGGRDIAAIPEAFFGSPIRNRLASPEPPVAPLGPRFVGEHYGEPPPGSYGPPTPPPPAPPPFVPPGTTPPVLPRILDLIRADQTVAENRPAFVPPTTSTSVTGEVAPIQQPRNPLAPNVASDGTVTPTEMPSQEPATQAAGAAPTPTSELGLTPQQEQAYRTTAEGQKLLESQQPGIVDNGNYVPGVMANTAETEQTVQAARELKMLKQQTPDLGQEAEQLADANNTARQNHYANQAGSAVQLQAAKDALAEQDQQQLRAVWANKTDADPQPVFDTAQQILAGEDGMRPAVRSAVNSVTAELQRAGTDPQLMYGVRKHIDDMLSPEGQRDSPLTTRVQANLLQLRSSLTEAIGNAAPGFSDYNAAHSAAMGPINAMQVLQDAEPSLYGSQNRMEYGRFQRFMKDVVDARQSSPVSPYNGISDAQMQALWGLRDDLRRSSRAVELARAQGSDSVQNLGDILRGAVRSAVPTTAGTILGTAAGAVTGSPTVGAVVGTGVRSGVENFLSGRAEAQRYRRGMEMLYPQQNTLMPPPGTPPP